MAQLALTLRDVRKHYGKARALDGMTLDVPKGALMGIVGPNGAGKTTAFGIVGGNVKHDSGVVDILGAGAFDPAKHAGRVTLVPQDSELNPHVPVETMLLFLSELQGATPREARHDVDRVLDLVELRDRAKSKIRELSHGMKRRVGVAQALLGDPELVLLDEPTSGLDPSLVVGMRNLLTAQRGLRTLIVSSHILADLEAVADHVAFFEKGRCIQSGEARTLLRQDHVVRYVLGAQIDPTGLTELNHALGVALRVESSGKEPVLVMELTRDVDPSDANAHVLRGFLERGVRIREIHLGESLESAYLDVSNAQSASRPKTVGVVTTASDLTPNQP